MDSHTWKIFANTNFATCLLLFATFGSGLSANSLSLNNDLITNSLGIRKFVAGGLMAGPYEFPYMAAFCLSEQNVLKLRCACTIVSRFHAVTAAHCVEGDENNPEKLMIMAGTTNVYTHSEENLFPVVWCIIHPNFFNNKMPVNDIAVCKVARSFADHPDLAPVDLPMGRPRESQLCTAIGWGLRSASSTSISRDLMKVNMPIYNMRKCAQMYLSQSTRVDTVGNICAGYYNRGKGVCQGDSGGPLICDGMLTGITSWGPSVCGSGPCVFTNVYMFMDFIISCLNE